MEQRFGIFDYPDEYIKNDDAFIHRELIDTLEPWVKAVREETTKLTSQALPFPDLDQAFEWLEITVDEERERLDGVEEIRAEDGRKQVLFLRYYNKNSSVMVKPLARGSALTLLANQTAAMGKTLDILPSYITAWVLADVKPPHVRLTVSSNIKSAYTPQCGGYPGGHPVQRNITTITVMSPTVTAKEISDLYIQILKEQGIDRKNVVKEREILLCHVVQDLGGAPKHGVRDFWKSVVTEYNYKLATLNPKIYGARLPTWEAAKKRFERFLRKETL